MSHPQMHAYRLGGRARLLALPDTPWVPYAAEIARLAAESPNSDDYDWLSAGAWLSLRGFARLGRAADASPPLLVGSLPFYNSWIYAAAEGADVFVASAEPLPWLDACPHEVVEARQ